jgi:hypothetical protein
MKASSWFINTAARSTVPAFVLLIISFFITAISESLQTLDLANRYVQIIRSRIEEEYPLLIQSIILKAIKLLTNNLNSIK